MNATSTSFAGAVLAGGTSRRMGVDKAALLVDGRALVSRVVDALVAAGATTTMVVGGDPRMLGELGVVPVADLWPGAGPLGGIATALADADTELVAVLACDLVAPDPRSIERVVAALHDTPTADLVVPMVDGRRQWLHAAWRRRARTRLERALESGERAVHRAVEASDLEVVDVADLPAAAVADADTVEELPPGTAGPDRRR
ncbi:MAG: molybdenum cofactor guanylyltransferase [Acidimicrobiales bacterium]